MYGLSRAARPAAIIGALAASLACDARTAALAPAPGPGADQPVAPTSPASAPAVDPPPEPEPPPEPAAPPEPEPAAPPEPAAASVAASPAPLAAAPVAPAATPRKLATWPFVAWDRAEAITYNHVAFGPGVQLRVYDAAHGWSPKIAERRPLTPQQGARAVDWVIATRGEVEVSKCAFPRHAVVLYSGETPVGTANICFECGDILVWPDLDPPPDYEHWTAADQRRFERGYQKKLAAYKRVFPRWERLFRDEVGFTLTPARGP